MGWTVCKKTFVGLNNYIEFFFDDQTARKATINTFVWTLGSLVIPSSLGLILALALNRGGKVSVVLRTIFYSPAVLPLVGVGLIWGWMYNPNFGVINVILKSVGLGDLAMSWLSTSTPHLPRRLLPTPGRMLVSR